MTFSQHMALAQIWAQWNGQRGTEKQALRIMRQLNAEDLRRMLLDRGVALPIGVYEVLPIGVPAQ